MPRLRQMEEDRRNGTRNDGCGGTCNSASHRAALRMARRAIALVCAVLLISTAGCRDAEEIETLGFILGLGIDAGDDGGVKVWAQVAMPSARPEETLKAESWFAMGEGPTLWSAVESLETRSATVLFRGHVRTVVIGERLARRGLGQILDALARDGQFRHRSWVLVTPDPVDKVLSVRSTQAKIAASYINSIMQTMDSISSAPRSTLLDLITTLEQPGDQPFLARVKLVDDPAEKVAQQGRTGGGGEQGEDGEQGEGGERGAGAGAGAQPPSEVEVAGAAVFNGDKMVGWLTTPQAAVVLMCKNKLGSYPFLIDLPDGQGRVGLNLMETRVSIDVPVHGGRLDGNHVTIRAVGELDLREVVSKEDFGTEEAVMRLNRIVSDRIAKAIEEVVRIAQTELHTDFIGIGEKVRQKVPVDMWEDEIGPKWHDIFATLQIEPVVRMETRRRGMTVGSPRPRS